MSESENKIKGISKVSNDLIKEVGDFIEQFEKKFECIKEESVIVGLGGFDMPIGQNELFLMCGIKINMNNLKRHLEKSTKLLKDKGTGEVNHIV